MIRTCWRGFLYAESSNFLSFCRTRVPLRAVRNVFHVLSCPLFQRKKQRQQKDQENTMVCTDVTLVWASLSSNAPHTPSTGAPHQHTREHDILGLEKADDEYINENLLITVIRTIRPIRAALCHTSRRPPCCMLPPWQLRKLGSDSTAVSKLQFLHNCTLFKLRHSNLKISLANGPQPYKQNN